MWTSTYYNHWDYWNLYHKVTFDGINKLILVNEGVTSLDVQIDIYSSWKEWLLLDDYVNTKYEQALTTVGGEPTIENQKLDVTYFLINGWKIKPYPGSYTLNIIGNIFDVDGGEIKVAADVDTVAGQIQPNNITINTNTSVIVRQVSPPITFNDSDRTNLTYVSNTVSESLNLTEEQGITLSHISGTVNSNYDLLLQLSSSSEFTETQLGIISSSVNSNNDLLLQISSSNEFTEEQLTIISSSVASVYNLNLEISASNAYHEQLLLELSASAAANGAQLIEISGSLVEIKSIFSQPVTASLVSAQEQALLDIQEKVNEIWKIHGLDINSPLTVNRTSRTVDDISQNISTIGSGSTQQTTITRN